MRPVFGHRVRLLETFLQYASGAVGVWNDTASAVISHWRTIDPAPRLEESIWRDYPGSLS